MESNNTLKDEIKHIEYNKANIDLINIKSNFILRKIYDNLDKRKYLQIIKYSKRLQNRLNISIKSYKNYSEIDIEIILNKNKYGRFINITENERIFYHIYLDDSKKEVKNKYEIKKGEKISKIRIIIDYQGKSFENLFKYCECIKSINFIKFYRNNIKDMSSMFSGCFSLKELNLSNFNTKNVLNMSYMFNGCSSLKELNLSNFNTNKVINMSYMFYKCSSLKELKVSSFKTNDETNMSYMFYECHDELKKMKLIVKNKSQKSVASPVSWRSTILVMLPFLILLISLIYYFK